MGSCSHTLYATCHRWSSCRPVNKAFVQSHKASLKGSAMPRIFLRMCQAALMTNGKSYWNYSSFSMNITLREAHLFPQETWLQQTKSLLTKNGGKGILLLKRRKDITFKWTGLSDFSNGLRTPMLGNLKVMIIGGKIKATAWDTNTFQLYESLAYDQIITKRRSNIVLLAITLLSGTCLQMTASCRGNCAPNVGVSLQPEHGPFSCAFSLEHSFRTTWHSKWKVS